MVGADTLTTICIHKIPSSPEKCSRYILGKNAHNLYLIEEKRSHCRPMIPFTGEGNLYVCLFVEVRKKD